MRIATVASAARFMWILLPSATAFALTPRVAICGRVTSFVDATPIADRIARLGTQEPRRLSLGSGVPEIGQELCFWDDVANVNPSASEPAPRGIVGYAIAPVASIGCADVVTATNASFMMPGQEAEAPQNIARLTLPLTSPANGGCVRIAIDAQGNPVAVVVRTATTPSPTVSSMPPRPSFLPTTSARDHGWPGVPAVLGVGLVVAAVAALALRRSRAIPSSRSC